MLGLSRAVLASDGGAPATADIVRREELVEEQVPITAQLHSDFVTALQNISSTPNP
ncbi:hypothetical protein ACFVHB_34790 [Kitasatospora sp. NPDC127111]|uniref:hypothetical protein n=1 Tax=Kitasatospora sp. NPDC127111 TaxID=3345363 RepID=UPI00362DD9BF